jgi:hypothetical protein
VGGCNLGMLVGIAGQLGVLVRKGGLGWTSYRRGIEMIRLHSAVALDHQRYYNTGFKTAYHPTLLLIAKPHSLH